MSYFVLLGFGIGIEFLVLYLIFFKFLKINKNKKSEFKVFDAFLMVFGYNIFTHVLMTFVLPWFINMNYIYFLVSVEFFIWILEGVIIYYVSNLKKVKFGASLFVSGVGNFLSWQIVPIIVYLFI